MRHSLQRSLIWTIAFLLMPSAASLNAHVVSGRSGGRTAPQQSPVTGYTVNVYRNGVLYPTTDVPVSSQTYPAAAIPCGQLKAGASTPPLVNPSALRWNDPASPSLDCVLPIGPQLAGLSVGAAYKFVVRTVRDIPGTWSPFSLDFTLTSAPQTHPCDGAPPSTGTVQEGTRTLTWCWDGRDANGNETPVTLWTITVDGTRQALTGVTVGATANGQGKRLYSASVQVARGTRAIRIAGTNTVGEAQFSSTFTVTVTAAPAPPSVAEIRGIS